MLHQTVLFPLLLCTFLFELFGCNLPPLFWPLPAPSVKKRELGNDAGLGSCFEAEK